VCRAGVRARRLKTSDIKEEQRLHCFLENARRHFMMRHCAGSPKEP